MFWSSAAPDMSRLVFAGGAGRSAMYRRPTPMSTFGTRMAITRSDRPICLDLSRLISRVGRGPMTGIDRVEMAYLTKLARLATPVCGLVRDDDRFIVVPAERLGDLAARLREEVPWGRRDLRAAFYRRHSRKRQQAMSYLRRIAFRRVGRRDVAGALAAHLGGAFSYLNVGHSNIDRDLFIRLKSVDQSRIVVLLHDVIPLELSAQQRPETVRDFARKCDTLAELADLTIYPSEVSRRAAARHFVTRGRVPPSAVVHLGVDRWRPGRTVLPSGLAPGNEYFVALGTIEPRKNHALLLDVWEKLGPGAPTLLILGRRGWCNEPLFARLDACPSHVTELNDVPDDALAGLLDGAKGLLFPSRAEGFGLPPAEAALLGVPVVCSDLPVLREVLGSCATYLEPDDVDAWKATVENIHKSKDDRERNKRKAAAERVLRTWEDHFAVTLKLL